MINDFLFELAKAFFKKNNKGNRKWNYISFWYGDFISQKQLNSAIDSFAQHIQEEEKIILLMKDDSSFKSGFIVTNTNFYYRLKESYPKSEIRKTIRLADINSIDIECKLFGSWLYINGKKEALISSYGFYGKGPMGEEISVLREFLKIIIRELQNNRIT